MSNFNIGLQKAKGGYRVVLYSDNNGKLVLSGEVIKNMPDALSTLNSINGAWNDERDTLTLCPLVIPSSHKWPKNSGPKKKAAKKMARSHVEAYVEGRLTKVPRKVLADPDFLRKKAAKKK